MSVMSDIFLTITESMERDVPVDEIAYQLTCEYPSLDIPSAYELINSTLKYAESVGCTMKEEVNG